MTSTDHLVKLQWELAESHSGITVEILGGELVVNASAAYEHDRIASSLLFHLAGVIPKPLRVFGPGAGVFERDEQEVEYFQPDILVHHPPVGERLVGAEVELVGEIISPSNRARGNYIPQVIERATRFGVGWVLIVEPEDQSIILHCAAGDPESPPAYAADIPWAVLEE